MLKRIIIALLCGLSITATPTATIDRIEGNYAVVEVGNKMVDIAIEDFNHPMPAGSKIAVSTAVGTFGEGWKEIELKRADGSTILDAVNMNPEDLNNADTYKDLCYQFKSYDDTVWWVLSVEEIGFIPEANKSYTLVYYDNNTTECFDCPAEYDCECEVYDDIFLGIFKGGI